ncbi:Hypothetical Protein FCC1311_026142 [Hondaea fermentalgiana]|uniref:Uncharacterized protein n=1 Tax=Hondaea fermentalgiana TaxID=2315210 RepID=A0A2R5GCT1_9STRA|nr:Hypothetical Protein FCC1311_026142 [Hondaea fermentalgiana]|eukprot:GBG26393.1 Hypothetical Protein FCC1311_026142 [Hondaea fermentalgiana]
MLVNLDTASSLNPIDRSVDRSNRAYDRTAPNRTQPHRTASHRIASHRIASHRIASHGGDVLVVKARATRPGVPLLLTP